MKNIFHFATDCLFTQSIDAKLEVSDYAHKLAQDNRLSFVPSGELQAIGKTQFPCRPKLVDPRNLPRRGFSSLKGRIALLHSIAHIEFYAIHLAWDIVYRFRDQPEVFYRDWLKVAAEEALHFSLLRQRLRDFEVDYGDFPAHKGLWEIAELTTDDLLARLALVPRTMEARGLDVTPGMIQKFQQINDTESVIILERILRDEIGHVAIGSRWFKLLCDAKGLDSEETYIGYVKRLFNGKIRRPINRDLRKQAGFTDTEIARLQNLE